MRKLKGIVMKGGKEGGKGEGIEIQFTTTIPLKRYERAQGSNSTTKGKNVHSVPIKGKRRTTSIRGKRHSHYNESQLIELRHCGFTLTISLFTFDVAAY